MRTYVAVETASQQARDMAIEYGPETRVGEVALGLVEWLGLQPHRDPTLYLTDDHLTLDPSATVDSTPLRSGSAVAIVDGSYDPFKLPGAEAVLEVLGGPAAGQSFGLRRGKSSIGRDAACAVRIPDQGLSRTHAVLRVSDSIAIADAGSKNGTRVNGEQIDSVRTIERSDLVALGNTEFRVRIHGRTDGAQSSFNRPPRPERVLQERRFEVPEPPHEPREQRVPLAGAVVPLVMAGGTFLVSSGSLMSLLFAAISPLVLLARHFESSRTGERYYARASSEWSDFMDYLEESRRRAMNRERKHRTLATPSAASVIDLAASRSPRLWERAIDDADCLAVGIGFTSQPSSSITVEPPQRSDNPRLADRAAAVVGTPLIPDVPIVTSLREVGNLGVASARPAVTGAPATPQLTEAVARSLLVQLTGLHSPRDLELCAVVPEGRREVWEWLKWLPHINRPSSVVGGRGIATGADGAHLVAALTALVAARAAAMAERQRAVERPTVVVLVDEWAGVEQATMTSLLERGPAVGVHTIWLGSTTSEIPASCGATIGVTAANQATVVIVDGESRRLEATPDLVGVEATVAFARDLSPVVDRSAESGVASMPSMVRLGDLVDRSLITDPAALGANWQTRVDSLAAPVGATDAGPLVLDLRVDGPHGLVAGTTGSGKSEFLQCFVAALAAMHPPSRMAFLFVDYKGGAAFRGCETLPHSVGMVTDLDPHLVQRVLVSLRAELSRRERILEAAAAKDLRELERLNHPDTPANLLIVIDEFAALSAEVPEFVDGVVDIAQRGRSLGLHLLLATQRPAGVVTDYIRANMNLRVALRVASVDESVDVVAAPDAAEISRETPGRAVVRLGPADLLPFQSGFVGAPITPTEPTTAVRFAPFGLGPVVFPTSSKPSSEDETELQRFVETARRAADQLAVAPPHRPWLSALEPAYALEDLDRETRPGSLAVGVGDLPSAQAREVARLDLAEKGHLLCVGTSGAGKTTFLRTVAAAADIADEPWWVYGLDFAGRSLRTIEALPSVGSVVDGDDDERVIRLLGLLRQLVDQRLEQLGRAGVSDIAELRASDTQYATVPRVALLLDGLHGFLADYERLDGGRWIDELVRLVSDGRPGGLHLVLTTNRRSGIPMRLASQIQQSLTLRLASADDYAMAGLKAEDLGDDPPPGRGILDRVETQVGVVGGATDGPGQTAALHDLAQSSSPAGDRPPTIGRLPEMVSYDDQAQAGAPAGLGVRGRDLATAAVPPEAGLFGIFGPRQSGRTNALHVACASLRTRVPAARTLLIGDRGDQHDPVWDSVVPVDAATVELLQELAAQLSRPDQLIVAVDDFSDAMTTEVDEALAALIPATRDRRCRLLIADEVSLARSAYGSPVVAELRRAKTGVLLSPDVMADGDLLSVNLSKQRLQPIPGRGVLVDRGVFDTIQIAYRAPRASATTQGALT